LTKELELKLPSMVPRVLFAIKPDTILSNSKEWKEAIEQFEQEFKSTHRKYIVCEDEITLRRELTTIVEVAMKP
jgi:hypothetical protein